MSNDKILLPIFSRAKTQFQEKQIDQEFSICNKQINENLSPQITKIYKTNNEIKSLLDQGNLQLSFKLAKKQYESKKNNRNSSNKTFIESQITYADVLFQLGDFKASLGLLLDSIDCISKNLEELEQEYSKALDMAGKAYLKLGYLKKAEEYFLKSLNFKKELFDQAKSFYLLSVLYEELGQYNQAMTNCEKSLKLYMSVNLHQSLMYAECLDSKANLLRSLGKLEESLTFFREALEIKTKILGKINHPQIISSQENIALVQNELGKFQESYSLIQEVVKNRESLYTSDICPNSHPQIADAYQNLGTIQQDLGMLKKSLNNQKKALSLRESIYQYDRQIQSQNFLQKIFNTVNSNLIKLQFSESTTEILSQISTQNHPDIASSYTSLGIVYRNIGHYEEAQEYLQKALKQRELTYGYEHTKVNQKSPFNTTQNLNKFAKKYLVKMKISYQLFLSPIQPGHITIYLNMINLLNSINKRQKFENLALAQYNRENYEESFKNYQKAHDIKVKIYSNDHIFIPSAKNNIAVALYKQGKTEQSKFFLNQSLQIISNFENDDKNNKDVDPYLLCSTLNHLAWALTEMEQPEKALQYYKKTEQKMKQLVGKDHLNISNLYCNIGITYFHLGDFEKALKYHEQAYSINIQVLEPHHSIICNNLDNIGSCYSKQQKHTKALEYHMKSLQIRKQKSKTMKEDIANSYDHVASTYYDLQKYKEALEYYLQELKIRKQLNQKGIQLASLLNNIAITYKNLENLDRSLKYHQKTLRLRESYLPFEHQEILSSISNIASILYDQEKYTEAIEFYKKELLLKEKLHTPQCAKVAVTLNNIGCSYKNINNLDEAVNYHRKALELRKKILKENDDDIISSIESISSTLYDMQRFQEGLESYYEELQLKIKKFGEDNLKVATTYNNIACTLKNLGQIAEALKMHQKSLVIKQKILGHDHLDVATSLDNIASIIYDQNDFQYALEMYKKVLGIRRKCYQTNNLQIAVTLHNLACTYHNLKDYESALQLQIEVLEMRKQIQGPESKDIITSLDNIASNLYDSGKYEQAIVYYQDELALMRKVEPENQARAATTLNNIACTLHNLKRLSESFEYHNQALKIRRENLGETHPETVSSLNNIASNLFNVGKLDEALNTFLRVLQIRIQQQECKIKIATAYDNVGSTYFSLLEFEKALEHFEQSYEIRRTYNLDDLQNSQDMINAARQMIQKIEPIRNLPITKYTGKNSQENNDKNNQESIVKGEDEEEICNICLENLNNNQELRVLPCSHFYHTFCIDKWLLAKQSCPNCRQCPIVNYQQDNQDKIE
ncbi:tetratricopeptide repeat protein (macronuclear) [Tetrahymena thermophila SB210]|uniref:Tetratricopeptide repeat protein n=1 Tax=Tetrahymena thermophila (strain SB210) TaxID=312017 RepID=I7M4E3_TETTS|nr:tetratricopeptide repeat protein [Tetrahymena thermophila SB210]EAS06316.2 tetratricopeptide repeat protein [Tetrahymena thermophila SB210]|eukprot:XP_001026561.2 tetratricopeptide repeat protein [Tetrahymena thermophila SB210]